MNFASLPWYDLAEIRHVTDAFWRRLAYWCRQAGIDPVPDELERRLNYQVQWDQPGLLLSQACGYDVILAHRGKLRIVAIPIYDVAGCDGPLYSSFVVVREDSPATDIRDLRGGRCVINTQTSHSGMNILRALVAPLHFEGRFFSSVSVSGSHRRSLAMIRKGGADVATVDCVTYALLQKHAPTTLDGTRVLHGTQKVPAPPLVTSARTSDDQLARLRGALGDALVDPELEATLGDLCLGGVQLSHDAYWVIEDLEHQARRFGYTEIDQHL